MKIAAKVKILPCSLEGIKFQVLSCAALLAIAILLFFHGLGDYALWDPWEPKYAKAISDMIARNDYLTPYMNDRVRWTKPILIYWSMLLPASIGEVNEWSVRLPSAVAALFGVLSVYFGLLKLQGRVAALIGACALATMPQYVYMSRQAMPDMLMTALLTAAMMSFAVARFKAEQSKYFLLGYIFLALAFLAKGPVVIALTVLAACLFFLANCNNLSQLNGATLWFESKQICKFYRVTEGALLFVLISAPWYLYMLIVHGDLFIERFVMYENLTRFQQPIRQHDGLITYYLQNLFHGMYPWSGFLPSALLFMFYKQQELNEEVKQRWFFLSWFLAIFILFSFSGTKQQHYILPITPCIAVLAAFVWRDYLLKDEFWSKPAMLLSGLVVWLCVRDFLISGDSYLFDVFTIRIPISGGEDIDNFLKYFLYGWLFLMGAAIFTKKYKYAIATSAVLLALLNCLYFTWVVMPAHTEKRTLKPYITLIEQHQGQKTGLVFYSARKQSSLYYYFGLENYQRIKPGKMTELFDYLKLHPNAFIIAEKRYYRHLRKLLMSGMKKKWQMLSDRHSMYVLLKP